MPMCAAHKRNGVNQPIAVFDSGIGSFSCVQAIRREYPNTDVVYLADRASFPYGAKTEDELFACCDSAIRYLRRFAPAVIVVASNAPSVAILPRLMASQSAHVRLVGVVPPIRRALACARGRNVVVAGVAAMVSSPQVRLFVQREAGRLRRQVWLRSASELVELVETGAFLDDPPRVQQRVDDWMQETLHECGPVGAITYSSTHLPFLDRYFRVHVGMSFLDPIDQVVRELAPWAKPGRGELKCLATATAALSVADLRQMLAAYGAPLDLIEVGPLT
jgi:glutamate racemase